MKKDNIVITIPSSILRDRKVSVLEAIVEYMKNSLSLSHHQIAVFLNRNERTIWTVYNRVRKKRGKR